MDPLDASDYNVWIQLFRTVAEVNEQTDTECSCTVDWGSHGNYYQFMINSHRPRINLNTRVEAISVRISVDFSPLLLLLLKEKL